MTTLLRSDYEIELADIWYGNITDEQIRSSLFDSDAWNDIDTEKYWCILTFDDIRSDFENWTPAERAEYLGDEDSADYTVYDWIRDCMMNSLSVVKSIKKVSHPTQLAEIDPSTIDPDTFECRFIGKSGSIITIDRYGQDDYSVWFTDDVTKDDHGCSHRGTFMDILDELKNEF